MAVLPVTRMQPWQLVVGVGALVLTFSGMVALAVWTVASVRNSTGLLGVEIKHLGQTNNRLASAIEKLDGQLGAVAADVASLHTRLAVLEPEVARLARHVGRLLDHCNMTGPTPG